MMNETCKDCTHKEICKYREKAFELCQTAENITAGIESAVFTLEIKCKHYEVKQIHGLLQRDGRGA